jgi:Ca2+-binding EF-hand superfamily protein
MFLSLDEDHNGTLTINDIRKGMENIDNMGLSNSIVVVRKNPEEYKELMIALDKNGDGVVSFDEFITAAIDKVGLLDRDKIKSAFGLIDNDGNG